MKFSKNWIRIKKPTETFLGKLKWHPTEPDNNYLNKRLVTWFEPSNDSVVIWVNHFATGKYALSGIKTSETSLSPRQRAD